MPHNNRFQLFSRQQRKKFALLPANNLCLSSEADAFMQEIGEPVILAQNTEPRTPDKYERERRRDLTTGTTYVELLKSTSGTLFVEETPERENQRPFSREINFRNFPSLAELTRQNPNFYQELSLETFSFSVTAQKIHQRVGAKRECSQNDVMGETAQERLTAISASLPGKMHRNEAVHWAHRHGWALGGEQEAFNLDLSTCGSNYSTLLWFEAPLKALMQKERIAAVQVQGKVYLHPCNEIPVKIEYQFTWGNGRKVRGCTYPIEMRWPTQAEYHASYALFKFTRTPQQPTRPVTKVQQNPDVPPQPDFSWC